jgi:hypothetical protein
MSFDLVTNLTNTSVLPISFLLDNSSIFAGLDTHPPESIIAQATKDSTMFEIRIALVQPDDNSWRTETRRIREESSAGGYEVRRRDWSSLKERIRKYTSFHWQEKSIYVVSPCTLESGTFSLY